ncbi:outer membrane protein assembly factor BamE [Emcibacteraceae bacterium]|nr:outer membrane protein assembly factor BamE [Emcibacteraceae bacterium]MDC0082190.1 outer membrane protein assembly factor BamE [Emcibacteraceae bacterium]
MKTLQKIIFTFLIVITISACSTITNTRGYIPDPEIIDAVRVDIDTKETVEAMLGNPTMKATFDDNNWYYYDKTTTQWAIRKEKVVEMNILAISFDQENYVSEIRKFTVVDNKVIDPVSQKTVTHGKEVNFVAELFGNVGRFGAADNSIAAGN